MPNTNDINESLANFEEELSKLKSASDEINKAKDLASETLNSSKTIIEKLTKDFEATSTDLIAASKSTFETLLSESEKSNQNLLLTSRETAKSVIDTSKKLQDDTMELQYAVDKLLEKIEKVDFPSRLDKLDVSVVGINSAIQNIFSRFDSVERNLKEDLYQNNNKMIEELGKTQLIIDEMGDDLSRSKRLYLIFLISTSFLSLAGLIILFVKLVF